MVNSSHDPFEELIKNAPGGEQFLAEREADPMGHQMVTVIEGVEAPYEMMRKDAEAAGLKYREWKRS